MGKSSSLWEYIVDIIETVVIAAAIFVVVYLFLLQPHQVKGASMEPNFHDGEYILTDKISYRFGDPKRGDVVIFRAPPNQNLDFIKRIIGLPGEKISIKDGKIIIYNDKNPKGVVLQEPYETVGPNDSGNLLKEGQILTLDDKSYLVLGDNRTHSSDSREWGGVSKELIVGKAWLRYWPLSSISFIKHINFNP
ncbi:MAG: signal peptidase I [Candidatus Woykebacteria bacterium RBG_16_39_9b]|uniref:Signal peptidase I n=1 Tax=Candidatus Woykebacteria bacterium RBG_16_39_9b TaxID=1802595 RepID=A0A1G1WBR7_9BACT|nr:MAG: signal peptidase I [Candidatus Woykebacteria bacterium RBG_16_39_9b]